MKLPEACTYKRKYNADNQVRVEKFLAKHYGVFLTADDADHVMELALREFIQPLQAYIQQEYQVEISFLNASRLIDMAKGDNMLELRRKKMVHVDVALLPDEFAEMQSMLEENIARAEQELKRAETHWRRTTLQGRIQRLKRMRTKLTYYTILENTKNILP